MESYKIHYNDGVYAETFTFTEPVSQEQKAAYIQKTIKEYNENPNSDYHISEKNIEKEKSQ